MKFYWFVLVLTITGTHLQASSLLVLNKDENALAIVDPSTQKVLGKVPTGEGPHEVAASSDGKFAFVSNYGARTPGNSISVIDLEARKERRVDVSPLGRPHGMFFADGKVYFTAEASKLIGRYDPATNKVDWLLGTGQNTTHMVMLSNDRSKIVTSNIGSDSISLIELAPGPIGWNETVIPVGKAPEAIDLSPDGTQLWAAHSRDGNVSVIDIAAKKVIDTLPVGTTRANRLKFTTDGKLVLISDMGGGALVVLDAGSRKPVKRIPVGRSPEGILVAPDGSTAYVAVTGENRVAILDLKTLEVVGQISTGKGPDGMAWAP